MSNVTRASAPVPRGTDAKPAYRRTLRIDAPHAAHRPLGGPLAWTDYVQPSVATMPLASLSQAASLPPAASVSSYCAAAFTAPATTAAEPSHISRSLNSQPVLRQLQRDRDVRTGVRRQRFYPEQWRRLQQPAIERLVKAHGRSLQWIGWERSLPRLYMPAGHLTQVLLDLLHLAMRQTEPAGLSDRPIALRAGGQIGATQAFVLVLEHPQLELSAGLMQYLNAPLVHSEPMGPGPGDAEELLRARRLLSAIGGSISASRARDGGTQFRLSVPADDRSTLVKAWLERVSHQAVPGDALSGQSFGAEGEAEQAAIIYQSQVSMFVLGRRQAETLAELTAADTRLQALAGSGDFVYRAARSRWLWLTMHDDLPPLEAGDGWQSQQVNRWSCLVEAAMLTEQRAAAFHGLARAVVGQMDVVLGRRVPPVDALTAPPPRGRRLRIDRGSSGLKAAASQQPARASLHASVTPSTGQRRWRYPI